MPLGVFSQSGCTDIEAENYCNNCIIDDGSCLYAGCTDPIFLEFYTQGFNADFDDGSCSTEVIFGCTDNTACNYNNNANIDSDNCLYAEQYYDCSSNCINDQDSDGVCDELDTNCNVTVQLILTNLCRAGKPLGVWR